MATVTDSVYVMDNEGADEGFSLEVYPNPARIDEVTVRATSDIDSLETIIRILDAKGQSLYSETHTVQQLEDGITPALPRSSGSGLYIVIAQQGGRSIRQKLIIKK
jgi:hypothetical protein